MIKGLLNFLKAVRSFFPINLLFSQVKYNLIVLFYWIFLFSIVNNYLGVGIGLPYLFLSPEYVGASNPIAFLLLGVSIGGFIMAFHIYSYIQLGPKYPFIATLSRPFYKFFSEYLSFSTRSRIRSTHGCVFANTLFIGWGSSFYTFCIGVFFSHEQRFIHHHRQAIRRISIESQ